MSNATPIQGHYDTSSVFVAVIGRPNVGKSSLTNLLVGEKVAIVTSKPQTTRTRITGVITRGPLQYVLLDTPGVHKARNKLGKRMDKTASDSIADVDVSMMLFEPYGALNESEMVLVRKVLSPDATDVFYSSPETGVCKDRMRLSKTENGMLLGFEKREDLVVEKLMVLRLASC